MRKSWSSSSLVKTVDILIDHHHHNFLPGQRLGIAWHTSPNNMKHKESDKVLSLLNVQSRSFIHVHLIHYLKQSDTVSFIYH